MATLAMSGTLNPHAETATSSRWLQVVSHLDPKYGGLSAAVPELARNLGELDSNGTSAISVAAFCAPDERFQPAQLAPEQLSFWPASRKAWLSDRSLRATFAEQLAGYDGVHIHGLWEQSTAVAAQSAHARGIPYVLSAHGMLEPWALAAKRLKKVLYSFFVERGNVERAACLHALTHAEAEQFLRFGARSPIAIIPNGVDVPSPRLRDSSLFLNCFPELQGKRIVLFLSRLHPKKGLDILLQAWSTLAAAWPDAHLVIAGPDCEDTQAGLQQFVSAHHLSSSVLFPGMLKNQMKWSALAAAEAFVLPSYSEGLSVSVLEAMGCGLPVVVTEPCNMPQVAHHHAGWQVAATADALITALAELLTNSPSENASIGVRGANLILDRYSWPTVASQMAEVYRWAQYGGPLPETVEIVIP